MLKKLIISLSLFVSTQAFALNFNEIAGTYEATVPGIPIQNIITVYTDGEVEFTEKSYEGEFTCYGQAEIKDFVLKSEVECPNGQSFFQEVDLTNVTNYSDFTAPVYSSLYEVKVMMLFTRL